MLVYESVWESVCVQMKCECVPGCSLHGDCVLCLCVCPCALVHLYISGGGVSMSVGCLVHACVRVPTGVALSPAQSGGISIPKSHPSCPLPVALVQ